MSKTIFITGSTDGIGKQSSIDLAKLGHNIIIHGRDRNKLQDCLVYLNKNTEGRHSAFLSDFSDIDSVIKMITEIKEEYKSIDVLINNAGVFKSSVQKDKNGIDIRMSVNYISAVVLSNNLLDLLKNSRDARIINLSSAAQSSISEKVLLGEKKTSEFQAYAQTKMAIAIWARYFNDLHKDISVVSVNPGSLINTKMVQEAFGKHNHQVGKGSDILCKLAVEMRAEQIAGKYYDNDIEAFTDLHKDAYKQEKINELIDITNSIIERITSNELT
ncbi:MAG: SDR family NAD(P)-dependent oxidoreductase [Marinifilaceae bacterium]|jgi:NAD(P)-dependent dehydrogenase (short-subunit alcohol dehydrogenase family)|nr:SDR family NAD(P)-dependent oxidoreductase [Marinifilaceae bacterium]